MLAVAYLLVGPPMPDTSKVMTQTKRDTLVLQVGGRRMRLKFIQKSCDAAKFEIHFRIYSTINQNILSSFYLVKNVFFFMELRGCSDQLIKCFTSMYDLSSSIYTEVYTSQLPDMIFEFFNFENL
jgi:hypothetical protein